MARVGLVSPDRLASGLHFGQYVRPRNRSCTVLLALSEGIPKDMSQIYKTKNKSVAGRYIIKAVTPKVSAQRTQDSWRIECAGVVIGQPVGGSKSTRGTKPGGEH